MSNKFEIIGWSIKQLSKTKTDFSILDFFLSKLLHNKIQIEKVLDLEFHGNLDNDDSSRAELIASNLKKELILIEIRYLFRHLPKPLSSISFSRMILRCISNGVHYSDIKKAILINIDNCEPEQNNDNIYRGHIEFQGMNTGDILQLTDEQRQIFEVDAIYKIPLETYIITP